MGWDRSRVAEEERECECGEDVLEEGFTKALGSSTGVDSGSIEAERARAVKL